MRLFGIGGHLTIMGLTFSGNAAVDKEREEY